MSRASRVAASFRLSRSEARLIHPSLRRIVSAHSQWGQSGKDGCSPRSSTSPHYRKDEGEYNPLVLAIIARALEKTTVASDTRRVHLDVFELAGRACHSGDGSPRAHGTLAEESFLRGPKAPEQSREDPQAGEKGFHPPAWLCSLHSFEPALATGPSLRALILSLLRLPSPAVRRDQQAAPAQAHGRLMGREISLGIAGGWNRSSAGGGVARPGQTRSALGPSVYRLLRAKTARDHHDLLHERIWNFVADRCRRRRKKRVCLGHV